MRLSVYAFLFALGGFIAGATLFTALSVAIAWVGPTAAPPNGDASAPINVGVTDQVKNGGLSLNALALFGNQFLSGASRYINFGTTTATGASGYGIRDNNGTMEFRNVGGSWTPIPSSGGSGGSGTSFTISSSVNNVNLYVLAGSPAAAANYTITINAGVTVGSSNSATAAVVSGTWPIGSTVTLINNGNIYGKGGNGGAAQNSSCNAWTGCSPVGSASAGGAGGPAISLTHTISINNTNGNIFGGGGGGGGGASASCFGNGGSGGQGTVGGSGGAGSSGGNEAGYAGNAGSASAPGAAQTSNGAYCHTAGGAGGSWAATGGSGAGSFGGSGAGGGAGGAAIQRNGMTVTWLGGNNATQVRGVVQ